MQIILIKKGEMLLHSVIPLPKKKKITILSIFSSHFIDIEVHF